jgi:hypothetical protein
VADWSTEQIKSVLRWFARQEPADLFVDVVVSAPSWRGWPDDAGTHRFDAVAVAGGAGEVHDWDEEAFEARVGERLRPIVAWGVRITSTCLLGLARFQSPRNVDDLESC